MITRRVSDRGYEYKTQDELYAEIVNLAQAQGIEVLPNSHDAGIARFFAHAFDNLYQDINQLRANTNAFEASGRALDELCLLKSIERLQPSKATVVSSITRDPERTNTLTLARGEFRVRDSEGRVFENTDEITLYPYNSVTQATLTSLAVGEEQNVNAGTLTEYIGSNQFLVQSVTNLNNASGGRDLEADDELRRRLLSTFPSVLSVVRLEQELVKLQGVRYARVVVNYTHNPSINGVSFEHTAVVIDDGRDENDFTDFLSRAIWEAMRSNSATNERWYKPSGAVELSYLHNGATVTYYVIKPTDLVVYVRVELTTRNNVPDNIRAITENIISEIIEGKYAGDVLNSSEIFNTLYQGISEYREASAIDVQIKSTPGGTWNNDRSLQLLYNQTPKLGVNSFTFVVNGETLA